MCWLVLAVLGMSHLVRYPKLIKSHLFIELNIFETLKFDTLGTVLSIDKIFRGGRGEKIKYHLGGRSHGCE
jgi:hypothetical protein